jgi:hypothetical protein
MVITRLYIRAKKRETEEIQLNPETDVRIPDISGAHVFLQGFAFPGFLMRSRARQRIRFEESVRRV